MVYTSGYFLGMKNLKEKFHLFVKKLQDDITSALQEVDPQVKVTNDPWEREDYEGGKGGGGITRAFQGKVIENAGVNTSQVFGKIDPKFAKELKGDGDSLWACGISLIIHPVNPRVPTVHANFRMIEQGSKFWFGGGADLTPFYPYPEDFKYFHEVWKEACAPYACYDGMKKECDEYFVNHHREGEMRGIGGIFFDHYNSGDTQKDFEMVTNLGSHFIKSYFPLVKKRMHKTWTAEDEDFQLHRRGRYVEFNLLHDRGTLFGLKTKGRVESILISLPARCKFTYNYKPTHPKHLEMLSYYRPKNWVE